MKKARVFRVYLSGRLIDTVFYYAAVDESDVKRDLVNHDGYDNKIVVRRVLV